MPAWFGIEEALQQYVLDSERFPTFLAVRDEPVAFLTVKEHFPQSWEVHCIAVEAACRGAGIGRALHEHVESWLRARGAAVVQVKTMAPSHPSPEYAQTRLFYASIGYVPLEVFPTLWGPRLPVLQLVKLLVATPGAT
ncbi:MAG: GNAT family N-acetyltransferase [Phycisphaerales bacterium]